MKKIDLYSVENVADLAWPTKAELITVDSPAIEIFTDFTEMPPLVIDADTLAIEAESFMKHAHVRLKIVVDQDNQFIGLISLDDLNSQEIIKHVSKGENREELYVTDFMRPKSGLKAFRYQDLAKFSIIDVIQALKESGQQHCLVVDMDKNEIRGIISASDISRKLKLPIDISRQSSFVSIFNALHH